MSMLKDSEQLLANLLKNPKTTPRLDTAERVTGIK